MKQICRITNTSFEISDEEIALYERLNLPIPTLSPRERQRRRISFRNFRSLYKRSCDATGEKLISMYHENIPFPVYDNAHWWSDNWEPTEYGRDFDFSKSFFSQYQELANSVPRYAVTNINSENCDYSNFAMESNNCYLVFGCVGNEDCMYGHIVWKSEHCLDCLYTFRCQWCSNSIDLVDCYDTHFSEESINCQESYFLNDCRNCQNCFCCSNLRNKRYHVLNQPYSKEEYYRKLKELLPLTRETITSWESTLEQLKGESAIYPPAFVKNAEQVTGNHIFESNNIHHSFDIKTSEDCRYCYTVMQSENCLDVSFTGGGAKNCVDSLTIGHSENVFYSQTVFNSYDVYNSEFCFSTQNLLGCIGLRNKSHCILNKQYSPSEYKQLFSKIVSHMKETGEWGEFFPSTISPFAYNESIAGEYLPLTQEELEHRKLKYLEPKKVTPSNGSEHICAESGKAYRVLPQEKEMLSRMNISISQYCPDVRHLKRMNKRPDRILSITNCANCNKSIETAYGHEAAASLFCESCYLEAVYE